MMCPAKIFLEVCEDYPETETWMARRAMMRRNHLFQTQKSLYERHGVESDVAPRLHRSTGTEVFPQRGYSETDLGRVKQKAMTDPYDFKVREQLIKKENCEIEEQLALCESSQ